MYSIANSAVSVCFLFLFLFLLITFSGQSSGQELVNPDAITDKVTAVIGQPIDISVRNLLSNDTDTDSEALFVATVANWENGIAAWNRDQGIITFTPTDESVTSAQFTYGVSDISSNSREWNRMDWASVTISFSIQPDTEKEGPVSANDELSVSSYDPFIISASELLTNDYDPNGNILFVNYIDDPIGGVLSAIDTERGIFTFTPSTGVEQASFTYGISDQATANPESMSFSTVTITVDVPEVVVFGEKPDAVADQIDAIIGQPIEISESFILSNDIDVDSEQLFVNRVTSSVNGVASWDRNAGIITFTPTDDTITSARFTYRLSDISSDDSDWTRMDYARVNISFAEEVVDPVEVNEKPEALPDDITAVAGQSFDILESFLLSNDFDTDSEQLFVATVSDEIGGTFVWNKNAGVITFTPTDNSITSAQFTYGISDVSNDSNDWGRMDWATVNITFAEEVIDPIETNETPDAIADQIDAIIGQPIEISESFILSNDIDVDSEQLFVNRVNSSVNGVASWDRDAGIITFTPTDDTITSARFTYRLSDISSDDNDWTRMDYARVNISFAEEVVDPVEVNEKPEALPDDITAVAGQSFDILESFLLSNDFDTDSEQLFVATVSDEIGGTFVWNKNAGVITFTPTDNSITSAQFTYGISDVSNDSKDWGRMDWARVNITFSGQPTTPTGALPVATNDQLTGVQGQALVINIEQLTTNDIDSDSDQLYIPRVSSASSGSVSLNADNTITFTPSSSDVTQAGFEYFVSDIPNDIELSRASSEPATVSITFSGNPVPVERELNLTCLAPEPTLEEDSIQWLPAFPQLPTLPPLITDQGTSDETQTPRTMIAMVQPKNDSSFWLLATVSGQVYKFNNDPQANHTELVFDLSDKLRLLGEMGLLGLAIHPDYPADNRVFMFFNDNPENDQWGGRSVIASYEIDTDSKQIDRDSEVEILTVEQRGRNHKGGDLAFDSEGLLYATLGDDDRGSPAQLTSTLKGKVIRIDIDSTPYSIPAGNPYYSVDAVLCSSGVSTDNASPNCPEIFALGLRNPWRFSIDQLNDDVWVGDVGQVTREEVSKVVAGGNYGWPYVEGSFITAECDAANCEPSNYDLPIAEFGRESGSVVIGGYVYRGTESPSLYGQYIYANASGRNLWAISAEEKTVANQPPPAIDNSIKLYSMAQGNDGEIYAMKLNPQSAVGDIIHKLSGSGGIKTEMPTKLSETGCFSPDTKQSAAGVFEYTVNSPLWSDGENKGRAFAIPDNSHIEVQTDGDYQFPLGSVLVKHFLSGNRYLETRLLIYNSVGWSGYSYEWNEDQTEASLLDSDKTVDIEGHQHIFPSRSQCNDCHSAAANVSLGIEHSQLNYHDQILDANVIDYLSDNDYFSSPQSSSEQPNLVNLDDESASLEQKARSYLHSNCSGCHRPSAAYGDIDLRYSTPFSSTNLCDVPPGGDDLGVEGARRVMPGRPDLSLLILRMQTLNSEQRMPPLATSIVDTKAVGIMSDWVTLMSSCN